MVSAATLIPAAPGPPAVELLPVSDGALEGITRRTVLEIASELGFECRERSLGRFDIFGADAAFYTGTRAGLVPIGSLDGSPIDQHGRPRMQEIGAAFEKRLVELSVSVD